MQCSKNILSVGNTNDISVHHMDQFHTQIWTGGGGRSGCLLTQYFIFFSICCATESWKPESDLFFTKIASSTLLHPSLFFVKFWFPSWDTVFLNMSHFCFSVETVVKNLIILLKGQSKISSYNIFCSKACSKSEAYKIFRSTSKRRWNISLIDWN